MNRVELEGAVASKPVVRRTPAGTPVASFRLRVEADAEDKALPGCLIPIVVLGADANLPGLAEGVRVSVTGGLAERRWKGPGDVRQSRLEILARRLRLM